MKWKHWLVWIVPFCVVGAALYGSYRARTADLRTIASPPMQAMASSALWSDYDLGRGVALWVSPAPTMAWANDRLPAWAKGDFSHCVEWQTDYYVIYRQEGKYLARGIYHGWIAVNRDRETKILELRRIDDLSGKTVTLIDAWAPPETSAPGG